jgi:sporulation protein YlmC with PRC-barrel domain
MLLIILTDSRSEATSRPAWRSASLGRPALDWPDVVDVARIVQAAAFGGKELTHMAERDDSCYKAREISNDTSCVQPTAPSDARSTGAVGSERRRKMRLSDESLRGRAIIAADGQVVGEVLAIFFESEAWRVVSLQAKLGKDIADQIGADHGMFHAGTLEIPVRMVQSVGDTVVLSVRIPGLREVLATNTRAKAEGAGHQSSKLTREA